ncbi:hypothetical protein P3T27_005328 [Kitasatospora sp. MAA19]|uniref:hypothetical protein n=1 Tax=unclassified Kitasatospora TaxID=2633591 RepID=UPI0024759AD5|nr:hypothetical protein [Kitasatospora sp. MAA19]MDH6708588.1 hypothetical protein [Kitasatospora sp. MAA19]
MGIELELHSARPTWTESDDWHTSRVTLLQGSYEHGEALEQVLSRLGRSSSGELCPGGLRSVDRVGDTLFDEREAEAALREIPGLLQQCTYESHTAAVRDLATLLASCVATPGSYLWFMGD